MQMSETGSVACACRLPTLGGQRAVGRRPTLTLRIERRPVARTDTLSPQSHTQSYASSALLRARRLTLFLYAG